jgi:hypothetical protein
MIAKSGQSPERGIESADLVSQNRPRRCSVQHDIRQGGFRREWELTADSAKRLGSREPISAPESSNLGSTVRRDDNDLIDSLVDSGFEQERHLVHDDRPRIFSDGRFDDAGLSARDAWMNDALQQKSFVPMTEDDVAERSPIDRSIRIEDRLPERSHDGTPGQRARLYDVSSQLVGVDQQCTAFLEHTGDGCLAGRNAAGEPDKDHGGGAYMTPRRRSRNAG